jgi:hypothetical protein
MRKLSKRDAVTKLKALAEIAGLLPSRDREVLRDFVPAWCHVYLSLALVNDRRVRAAAHGVMSELAGVPGVRKAFAPLMGSLVAHWWLCVADPARFHTALSARAGTSADHSRTAAAEGACGAKEADGAGAVACSTAVAAAVGAGAKSPAEVPSAAADAAPPSSTASGRP